MHSVLLRLRFGRNQSLLAKFMSKGTLLKRIKILEANLPTDNAFLSKDLILDSMFLQIVISEVSDQS